MIWILRLVSVFVILIVIQAIFFRKIGLKSVSCRRWFSTRFAFEGDEILMCEEISNEKPVPVPLLVIESCLDRNIELSSAVELDANESNYHRSLFSLMPFSRIVRRHKVRLSKRGYYNLKSVAVSAYDLLGLSKQTVDEVITDATVTVYPSLLDIREISFPCHSFLGDAIVRRWILDDPFLNAGVREYSTSDPMKSINWKASARTGILQVNKHDYSANTRLLVLFNVDSSERQWDRPVDIGLLEYALSACATVVKTAIDNSMDVAFMSNGYSTLEKGVISEVPTGSGEQHLYAILEALALLTFNHVYSFNYFLSRLCKTGIHDTDILIISLYADSEMMEHVELLRLASNSVELMIVGEEASA